MINARGRLIVQRLMSSIMIVKVKIFLSTDQASADLKVSPVFNNANTVRAILLAKATAAMFLCLRAMMD